MMKSLYKAFEAIKNEKEFDMFMADLLTPVELNRVKMRWKIAQSIYSKQAGQHQMAQENSLGIGTVSRVSLALKAKSSGYKMILERLV